MKSKYNIIQKKKIYDGFFQIHELSFTHQKHDGTWSTQLKRELFSGAHVASVLPYDPINNRIILINQFRASVINRKDDPMMLEIVAGMIDQGETPEAAAKRECMEETGCNVKKLIDIYSYYPAPGSSESFYHIFLGEVESFNGKRILGFDEGEDILVQSYSIDEIKSLLDEKKINNGLTLIALQWFLLKYYN